MLSHGALPHAFWVEAMKIAIHIINRSSNMRLGGEVPEQKWTGKPPSYEHLQVFGCVAYVPYAGNNAPNLKLSFRYVFS